MNDITARFPGVVKTNLFRGIFAAVALLASAMLPAYSADYYNIPAPTLAETGYDSSISGEGSSTGWSTTQGGSRAIAGITAENSVYHVYSDFVCRSSKSSYATPASSSIKVEAGVSWMIFGKQAGNTTTLNNLTLAENSTLHYFNNGDGGIGTLAGSFTMAEGSCLKLSGRYFTNARPMNLSATVTGSGSIEFFRYDNDNGYTANQIVHSVTGDISAFTGDLVVYDYNNLSTLVLELTNASSLPGDPAAEATAKVVVTNGATLRICQDWTSPANRTWDFGDGNKPTVYVASGKTVTIYGAISGSKGFTKTGEGKLVLAGGITGFTGDDITVSGGKILGDNFLLITPSIDDEASSPNPAYGLTNVLVAGASFAVSCGTTPWANDAETIVYACTGWKLYDKDNTVVSNGNETSFTYTHPDPAAYRKLEWQWEPIQVRGTIAAGPGGTVNPSGTAMYPCNTEVTVTATPEAGGHFIRWVGNLPEGVDATSAAVEFTPTAPFEMTAIFLSEFYVATTGSDDNSGSESSPFATISYAIENANMAIASGGVDAATIHVAAGTYTEYNLTLSNPITIVGEGASRDDVIVQANAAKKGTTDRRVFVISNADAAISGLTVRYGAWTTVGGKEGGNILLTAGTITNCHVTAGYVIHTKDYTENGVGYQGCLGANIYMTGGLVVDSEVSYGEIYNKHGAGGGNNIVQRGGRILRCEIHHGMRDGTASNFVTESGGGGILLWGGVAENCLIRQNSGTYGSVSLRGGSNSKLINCSVIGNSGNYNVNGIIVTKTGAKVVNCVIYDNGDTPATEWGSNNAACFINCAVSANASSGFTGSGCVATLTAADFENYSSGNYTPSKDGALYNAGNTAGYTQYGAVSTTDLAGDPRLKGKFLDIGCYEFSPHTGLILIVR